MERVLLINANNNVALTIARGLGHAGVPVCGVGWDNGGVGLHSRYFTSRTRINDYMSLTEDTLKRIVSDTGARHIMGMDEEVLLHLNNFREELESSAKFLFPENSVLIRAFDKAITLQYAEKLGIDCPKTTQIKWAEDVEEIIGGVRFPVVLKYPTSNRANLPPHLRFAYRIIAGHPELKDVLEGCIHHGVFPLVQEYIRGNGIGVELCLYNGEVVAAFQHERIHELPLSGGASVYRKSVPLSNNLLRQSVALLRMMDWDGVAMVEYRKDPETGRIVLMEVNGRFWGSLPLAVKAGVNFPFVLYQTLGQGLNVRPISYRENVKVKQSGGHIRWLWQALIVRRRLPPEGFMTRRRVLWEFILSCDPRVGFDVEEWDDPIPGAHYWLKKFRRK